MKKQKGRVIPSNQEILRRLDKIEKGFDLTFTYSILLTLAIFAISVSTSLFAMYYSTKNYDFLASGLFVFIIALVIIVGLIMFLIKFKLSQK